MNNLLKILELISSRNVEVSVRYEEATDAYIFRIMKRDVPIRTVIDFMVSRFELEHLIPYTLFVCLVEENINKLDELAEEHMWPKENPYLKGEKI